MSKRKKLTSKQIVEAIIRHKMDVSEFDGMWEANAVGAGSGEHATLEKAVYMCAKEVETRIREDDRKEREEYERLKAKYG